MRVRQFVKEHGLGRTFGNDTRFLLERDPDTARGPDVAFLCRERAETMPPEGHWVGGPDLAIEVISPGNRPGAIQRKIGQYLDGGCRLVWAIDELRERAVVYGSDGSIEVLGRGDALDGGEVLPGFRCPLADLFDA